MNLTKKIWHDENSEPPKNYLWAKRGKLFKYVNGQWKEISKNSSNSSRVDISNFINVVNSLKNSGTIIYNVVPYNDEIEQTPHRSVYGNQGDYIVVFGSKEETEEESELLVAFLTEEESNELFRRKRWHFEGYLSSGGWVRSFDSDISNYALSIPVSKELPLWEYSEDHEYTLNDISERQYIVAPIFGGSRDIDSYLSNAESRGYNICFFLHSGYDSLEEQPLIAVKIYNETETHYFPAGISVNTGPM